MSSVTIPGAWYDLVGRIGAAQAVASCALEAVPCRVEYERGNHAADLIAAMQGLLTLMQQDATQIEAALRL